MEWCSYLSFSGKIIEPQDEQADMGLLLVLRSVIKFFFWGSTAEIRQADQLKFPLLSPLRYTFFASSLSHLLAKYQPHDDANSASEKMCQHTVRAIPCALLSTACLFVHTFLKELVNRAGVLQK